MSAQSQPQQVVASLRDELHHLEKAGGIAEQSVDLLRRFGPEAIHVGYPSVTMRAPPEFGETTTKRFVNWRPTPQPKDSVS